MSPDVSIYSQMLVESSSSFLKVSTSLTLYLDIVMKLKSNKIKMCLCYFNNINIESIFFQCKKLVIDIIMLHYINDYDFVIKKSTHVIN